MENVVVDFILKYKYIILFYLVIIILAYINRKKIEVQGKIILLYRMKWGLKWMDKYSSKYREWVILLGYVGVGAGFVGLVFISYMLIKNLYLLFTVPETVSGVSLVLPGINIPGLGVLPFWYWIVAIFIIAIVHEFSHGIVARAHNIKVKNTGIVLFGPIIGAFVEPDEKNLSKQSDIKQYSVLAAGAFSNIILAIIAFIALSFVFVPLQETMIIKNGFTFEGYSGENMPFETAGIKFGTVINGLNGQSITNFNEFKEEFIRYRPGDKITINTLKKDISITLAEHPDNPKYGYMGIIQIKDDVKIKENFQDGIGKIAFNSLEWLNGLNNGRKGFLFWLFLLSFGIGLFNLLPLPIVDGGRMAQVFLHKLKGVKKGQKSYIRIGLFFLLVLLLNLLLPMIIKWFQ